MGGEECFEIKLLPQERYANAELCLASLGLGLGVAFFKGFKKNCENALIWVSDGVASRSGLNFKGKSEKSSTSHVVCKFILNNFLDDCA